MTDNTCLLSDLTTGSNAIIIAYDSCDEECQKRLSDLGLYIGCTVRILSNDRSGRMVVSSGASRVALDENIAGIAIVVRD